MLERRERKRIRQNLVAVLVSKNYQYCEGRKAERILNSKARGVAVCMIERQNIVSLFVGIQRLGSFVGGLPQRYKGKHDRSADLVTTDKLPPTLRQRAIQSCCSESDGPLWRNRQGERGKRT